MPMGVERRVYEGDTAQPMKPQLLAIALALLFADIVAVLLLQAGGLARSAAAPRRAGTAALAALAIAAAALLAPRRPGRRPEHGASAPHPPREPRADDARAIQATGKVTFGYVLSGDGATDEASRQGLDRPRPVPHRAHGRRAGRAVRRQHPQRRDRLLPDALLAGAGQRAAAARGDAHQDRRLHEAGRHDHLRHQGLRPGHADRLSPSAATAARRCSGCSATSTFRAWSRCRSTTC